MNNMFDSLISLGSLIPEITVTTVIEIVIISVIVYYLMKIIMDSRAWTLLKGIGVILAFTVFVYIFRLTTILWLMERISTVTVIALVVIFQPELRRVLEQLGSQDFINRLGMGLNLQDEKSIVSETTCDAIQTAVYTMAKARTGALIVIEQNEDVSQYVNSGITIDGSVSSALLINIFEKNTPLHDGAVIIRGNTLLAATCYLPLSENEHISKEYGTRHRAALGMSEVTDSYIVVVSEETGKVSIAHSGVLQQMPDPDRFGKYLLNNLINTDKKSQKKKKSRKAGAGKRRRRIQEKSDAGD